MSLQETHTQEGGGGRQCRPYISVWVAIAARALAQLWTDATHQNTNLNEPLPDFTWSARPGNSPTVFTAREQRRGQRPRMGEPRRDVRDGSLGRGWSQLSPATANPDRVWSTTMIWVHPANVGVLNGTRSKPRRRVSFALQNMFIERKVELYSPSRRRRATAWAASLSFSAKH